MVFMYLFQMPNTLNTQRLVCVFIHIYLKNWCKLQQIYSQKMFSFIWNQAYLCPIFKLLIEWVKAFISHWEMHLYLLIRLNWRNFSFLVSFPFQSRGETECVNLCSSADMKQDWPTQRVSSRSCSCLWSQLTLLNRPGLTELTQSNWLSVEQSSLSCWCQVKRCLCYSALESRPLAVRLTHALRTATLEMETGLTVCVYYCLSVCVHICGFELHNLEKPPFSDHLLVE